MVILVEDADPAKRLRIKQGKQLRMMREELRKMTVKQVVEGMNELDGIHITQQAVNMWERGETTPRPHMKVAICKVLNIHPSSIWNLDAEVA